MNTRVSNEGSMKIGGVVRLFESKGEKCKLCWLNQGGIKKAGVVGSRTIVRRGKPCPKVS